MPRNPGEGQLPLFDPTPHPEQNSDIVRAIQRGQELAASFMQDPDSYGANWPSATLNNAASTELVSRNTVTSKVTTPEHNIPAEIQDISVRLHQNLSKSPQPLTREEQIREGIIARRRERYGGNQG